MKEALRQKSFVVFDDVLSPVEFASLWEFMQLETYKPVHAEGWEKVWRLRDGMPLAGPGVTSSKNRAASEEGARFYPTRRGIDTIIRFILENSALFSDFVGQRDRDWSFITAKAFLYPPGSGLSWHIDTKAPTGAWVFYSHPTWRVSWGGELLIADDSCHGKELESYRVTTGARMIDGKLRMQREEVPSAFDDRKMNEVLSEMGGGHYIMPKANRLVVMRNGIPHCIAKVDAAAGENVRCSVAGFFQQ
jgi:hypothetical protein